MATMRLQKFLSRAGFCSRRAGEKHILSGHVSVNGLVVEQLGCSINPSVDRVEVLGKQIVIRDDKIYIVLNKPRGYVSSCHHRGERVILDLIDIGERLYQIGRLDKNSTGLILLTNDGALHHKLSHPSFDHEKEYDVTVDKPITDSSLKKLSSGIPVLGRLTRQAAVKRISKNRFKIILKEGRNRQIRRMVASIGYRVTELKRIRVSNIRIGRLRTGQWRHLTKKEKEILLQMG